MKAKQYKILLISTFIAILATSCASTSFLSIDVKQPAMITFPESIVSVAIVDNAGAALNDSVAEATNVDIETRIKSSTKEVFLESLYQFLGEENYFYEVARYPHAVRTDTEYGGQAPLSVLDIQQIANDMNVDAIISIDMIDVTAKEVLVDYQGFIYSGVQANMSLLFRTYHSSGKALSPAMLTEDSIAWAGDRGLKHSMENYKELALKMSEGMVNQLVPHWEQQERWLYSDRTKLMKEAKKLSTNGIWDEAIKTWQAVFESAKNDMQKAKIACNIALGYENLDNIEESVAWIRKAANLIDPYSSNNEDKLFINWYKFKLLQREQNINKLHIQLGMEGGGEIPPTIQEE